MPHMNFFEIMKPICVRRLDHIIRAAGHSSDEAGEAAQVA